MHGNRKLFERAKTKWEQLKKNEYLSLAPDIGKTAIISSFFTDEPPDTETGITELESFRTEAYALADRVRDSGGIAELAIDATRHDITRLIQDPAIANMYVIGNGSLATLILGEKDYYDWQDVANATDHLKKGNFIQRQCGGLTRVLNVPLGLFAVDDPRNVHAAFDTEFYPLSLDDPVNEKIQPVFGSPVIGYEAIKGLGSVHDVR